MGTVTGEITLNGEPLTDATVEFLPLEGRPSSGQTDEAGRYSLSYNDTVKGAVIGSHLVRITTARERSGGEGDQPLIEARPEIVPAKYNDQSELSAEVKRGANTFNFQLEGERNPKKK